MDALLASTTTACTSVSFLPGLRLFVALVSSVKEVADSWPTMLAALILDILDQRAQPFYLGIKCVEARVC
jgi:threonine/homoserine/homoserine lactone efflux protein